MIPWGLTRAFSLYADWLYGISPLIGRGGVRIKIFHYLRCWAKGRDLYSGRLHSFLFVSKRIMSRRGDSSWGAKRFNQREWSRVISGERFGGNLAVCRSFSGLRDSLRDRSGKLSAARTPYGYCAKDKLGFGDKSRSSLAGTSSLGMRG